MFHDVVEQLASWDVLSNEVQLPWRLDILVKLDDIWVTYGLEYFDLTGHSLHIDFLHDLVLFKDLDGDFLASEVMFANFDLAKSTLSDGLAEFIVSYVDGFLIFLLAALSRLCMVAVLRCRGRFFGSFSS